MKRLPSSLSFAVSLALASAPLACGGDQAASPSAADAGTTGAGAPNRAGAGGSGGGSSSGGRAGAGGVGSARAGSAGLGGSGGSIEQDEAGAGGALNGDAGNQDDHGRAGSAGSTNVSAGAAGTGGSAGTAGSGGSAGEPAEAGAGGVGASGDGGSSGAASTPLRVTVIGASTAAGKNLPEGGFSLADSFVNRYAAYLATTHAGSQVTNLAVSGYGTFHALPTGTVNPSGEAAVDPAHNVTAALATAPDAILVAFPSQSVISAGHIDQVLANLHTIADTAAAAGVPVWVTTTQPNDNTAASIPAQLDGRDQVLADFGSHAIDFWTPLADANGLVVPAYLNGYDGVHPSAEGHRVLFEAVVAADLPAALGR